MMRAESPPPVAAPLPGVPAWALPADAARQRAVAEEADAAFLAGAALCALDRVVRSEAAFLGAWRQRLALRCAAAAVRMAGRGEDEAALRDAWLLRGAGDDPGPAGNILAAWRRLAAPQGTMTGKEAEALAALMGLGRPAEFCDLPLWLDEARASRRAVPIAAAALVAKIHAVRPDAEMLGWWLADRLVAERLGWAVPVPLLAAERYGPAFRAGTSARAARPGGAEFGNAACLAAARAADRACRLAAEMARRAERLAAAAPKLRSKGAGEVIRLLLADDAVSGSLTAPGLSRFAARRLFARLLQFEAVRELSGRPAFRIFGL